MSDNLLLPGKIEVIEEYKQSPLFGLGYKYRLNGGYVPEAAPIFTVVPDQKLNITLEIVEEQKFPDQKIEIPPQKEVKKSTIPSKILVDKK